MEKRKKQVEVERFISGREGSVDRGSGLLSRPSANRNSGCGEDEPLVCGLKPVGGNLSIRVVLIAVMSDSYHLSPF